MSRVNLRRLHYSDPNAMMVISELQKRLSPQGDIVSPTGRALTERVFGTALTPIQSVERICRDVREHGLPALLDYTEKFDHVHLDRSTMRVSARELSAAHAAVEPAFLETVRQVRENVLAFQAGLLHRDACMQVGNKHKLRLRYRPLKRIGICIPGGAAAYPSTLLMTVCPAQAAGVEQIVVIVPPTAFGGYNNDILATCHELGIREIYRIGGAQGVAALAYGVDGIEPVDMIAGPGNLFVTLAKKYVYGQVAIDMLAGPSEVLVLADETANPVFLASDLISQAEHSPGASVLLTWHESLLSQVHDEVDRQLTALPRGELAKESLEQFGLLIATDNEGEAIGCANRFAPEHLHISTKDPESILDRIENAGAIFLGHFSPVALGDYVAGPSHVLPTGGTARFASGLTANDFLKRSSVIMFSQVGLAQVAPDVKVLAEKEGLTGHWASVQVRLDALVEIPDALDEATTKP